VEPRYAMHWDAKFPYGNLYSGSFQDQLGWKAMANTATDENINKVIRSDDDQCLQLIY